jgi:hypothetical protein
MNVFPRDTGPAEQAEDDYDYDQDYDYDPEGIPHG